MCVGGALLWDLGSLIPVISCQVVTNSLAAWISSGVLQVSNSMILTRIVFHLKFFPFLILILLSGAAMVTNMVHRCSPSVVIDQHACHLPCDHFWKGVLCWLLKIRTLSSPCVVSLTTCCRARGVVQGMPASTLEIVLSWLGCVVAGNCQLGIPCGLDSSWVLVWPSTSSGVSEACPECLRLPIIS